MTKPSLEGWTPELENRAAKHDALDKAFDYRGDVTLRLGDGRTVEGYVFNRVSRATAPYVQLYPKDQADALSGPYDQIVGVAFSGRDTAAGASWEAWLKAYEAKRAAALGGAAAEPTAVAATHP
ncbi:MAG: hypothetical protein HZA54_13530, partial [Planctomycetes bacterium]|nr:hypothetical protein [Planctomycetota bacterium]